MRKSYSVYNFLNFRIFNEGKTIIVKNQKDSLGRVSLNKIIINNNEYVTNYQYDKTRVNKQIFYNGDEINYERIKHSSTLYANFFMIKLLKSDDPRSNNIVDRILKQKDIVKIGINFNNGAYQEFDIAKRRIVNDGLLENKYEEVFLDENNDLCILICDKALKYKKNLFA